MCIVCWNPQESGAATGGITGVPSERIPYGACAMSRSNRPRLRELRGVYLLAGECLELGADPLVWRTHLAQRVTQVVGDSVALVYELSAPRLGDGELAPALVDAGWRNARERRSFTAYLESEVASENPLLHRVLSSTAAFETMSARSVLPLATWRRLAVAEYITAAGLEIDCFTTTSRREGAHRDVITVHAHQGRRALSIRERRALSLLHRELLPHLGVRLASFGAPSALDLPPRARQVLLRLLMGDSVKQAARRLGLSVHTVNDYTKRIHEHFGVQSRGELLFRLGGLGRSPAGARMLAEDGASPAA